jgi:hypothetical protein
MFQEIQGPLEGVLRTNYRRFDWEEFAVFFPPACYAGTCILLLKAQTLN